MLSEVLNFQSDSEVQFQSYALGTRVPALVQLQGLLGRRGCIHVISCCICYCVIAQPSILDSFQQLQHQPPFSRDVLSMQQPLQLQRLDTFANLRDLQSLERVRRPMLPSRASSELGEILVHFGRGCLICNISEFILAYVCQLRLEYINKSRIRFSSRV